MTYTTNCRLFIIILLLTAAGHGLAADTGAGWMTQPILHCEASVPAPKMRDGQTNSWWLGTHQKLIQKMAARPEVRILFVGDSITDSFDAETMKSGGRECRGGKAVWDEYYAPRGAFNLGIAGDTTQAVLWRLQHGGLDGIRPEVVILTIGHNNHDPAEEIAAGMLALLKEIRTRQPQATLLFIPHFPTTKTYWVNSRQIKAYRIAVERVQDDEQIIPLDLNEAFLNEEGVLKDPALIPDDVHPAEPGFRVWAEAMEPVLETLLADGAPSATQPDRGAE